MSYPKTVIERDPGPSAVTISPLPPRDARSPIVRAGMTRYMERRLGIPADEAAVLFDRGVHVMPVEIISGVSEATAIVVKKELNELSFPSKISKSTR